MTLLSANFLEEDKMSSKFIIDAEKLIEKFPEPHNMKAIENNSEYLCIHHSGASEDVVDMCSLEISHEGSFIELRNIAITEYYKGMGYGSGVLKGLIDQCCLHKLGLFSDLCYIGSISVIRSIVAKLTVLHDYEEYGLDDDGTYRFQLSFH